MKAGALREMTPAELERRLTDALRELGNLQLRRKSGKGDVAMRVRGARREIARLRTVIAERAG